MGFFRKLAEHGQLQLITFSYQIFPKIVLNPYLDTFIETTIK